MNVLNDYYDDYDNDDEAQSFKGWLNKNGHNLKEKTHQILADQAIDTLSDFKNLDMEDFEELCKDFKVPYGDKAKLKRILESFSSKDKFIDPEEVEAISNIKDEINKLQYAKVPRGGISLHNDKIIHGSGGNNTDGWRRTYVIAYRPKETIKYERSIGFTHSHNDVDNIVI